MSGLVYDKKQLPQVIGLGVLSAGLLGYFGLKMITPPPTQAAAPATSGQSSTSTASGASVGSAASNQDSSVPVVTALIGASAPSDTMRDPFTPPTLPAAVPSGATQNGTTPNGSAPKAGAGAVPGLPNLGQVQPLPVRSAVSDPTAWAVTGIIRSDRDPDASLAIFRSGTERRYVRLGSMVDESTRLIEIDRGGVTVSRNNDHIRLTLGIAPAPPAPAAPAPSSPGFPSFPFGPALPSIPGLNTREPSSNNAPTMLIPVRTERAMPSQPASQPKASPPGMPV
jgi:hypothetical protein